MIEELLKELKETWDFTTEELNDIKSKMANYACYACIDSLIRKEAREACLDESN